MKLINNLKKIKLTRPQIAFFRIIFIYMLPMVLIAKNIIPEGFYLPVLIFLSIFVFYFVYKDKTTKEELGITKVHKKSDYVVYIIATILGALGIIFFAKVLGYEMVDKWYTHPTFLLLFIPISVLQEFAYRSVLTKELNYIFDEDVQIILANAGIFAILHIFYPKVLAVIPLTFIGGIYFAMLWRLKPNFYLISFMHIVLNFTAMIYGFFNL